MVDVGRRLAFRYAGPAPTDPTPRRTAISLRLGTALTAALLTATPLFGTASPASAAVCTTPVTTLQLTPRAVVLDVAGTATLAVTATVDAGGCTGTAVTAVATSASRAEIPVPLTAGTASGEVNTWTGELTLSAADLANADAGRWRVRATTSWAEQQQEAGEDDGDDSDGDDSDGDDSDGDGAAGAEVTATASVRAASAVTAEAGAGQLKKGRINKGRIKKGTALVIAGQLTRADWDAGVAAGYGKQHVDLQVRTASGGYKKIKSVSTGKTGAFSAGVKARKDGCYRVSFRGSKTAAPSASAGECIDVR